MGEARDCLSEHDLEAEEVVHTDDATQVHGGRTEAAIAENNSWERALREAATREQMREWGREQDDYAPHDALTGAGEMAM